MLSIVIMGTFVSNLNWNNVKNIQIPNKAIICNARILETQSSNEIQKFVAKINSCAESMNSKFNNFNFRAKLIYPSLNPVLKNGDLVRMRVKLRKPKDYKNPGSFPFSLWLTSTNISATGFVTPSWIAINERNETFLTKARNKIISSAKENTKDYGLLIAIATGDRSGLSLTQRESFSKIGIAHLLAISGLHVGYCFLFGIIIVFVIGAIFPKLYNFMARPKLEIIVGIPMIWSYIALIGFTPSALRAGVMITLISSYIVMGRKISWSIILGASLFFILSANPLLIFNISFQLSIAAVIGITLFFTRYKINEYSIYLKYIVGTFIASLSALIATAPIVAFYFHEVSLMGIFTNIIAIPLMGFLIFPATTFASVISIFSEKLSAPFWKIAGFLSLAFNNLISFIGTFSESFILHLSPSIFEIILFYSAVIIVVFWEKIDYKKIIVPTLLVLFLISHIGAMMPNKFKINIIDVGQGSATLVQFSNGEKVLVDGGGVKSSDFDIGKNVLAPTLWAMGIRKINTLILSHPHHDHYRGLAYIAEMFDPKILWTNGEDAEISEIEEWTEFKERIKKTGVKVQIANSKTKPLQFGNGKITFLHPSPDLTAKLDPNDASLVLLIEEDGKKALIAGDLMKAGEEILLSSNQNIECDLLIVGHHGSNTSSTRDFIKATNPKLAIISVGKDNPYGMPDEEVLTRFERMGIEVRRTDLNGMVKWKP